MVWQHLSKALHMLPSKFNICYLQHQHTPKIHDQSYACINLTNDEMNKNYHILSALMRIAEIANSCYVYL